MHPWFLEADPGAPVFCWAGRGTPTSSKICIGWEQSGYLFLFLPLSVLLPGLFQSSLFLPFTCLPIVQTLNPKPYTLNPKPQNPKNTEP